MIKPAICYKNEIESALSEYFYTNDMMYYIGYNDNALIKVVDNSEEGKYQYAVLNSNKNLIGYIAYYIDLYSSSATGFAAFSFVRGNPIMGKELFIIIEALINTKHRVEFRAVSGNPAIKGYDSFLESHSNIGNKVILKDVFKDNNEKYHDEYIYEFINNEIK